MIADEEYLYTRYGQVPEQSPAGDLLFLNRCPACRRYGVQGIAGRLSAEEISFWATRLRVRNMEWVPYVLCRWCGLTAGGIHQAREYFRPDGTHDAYLLVWRAVDPVIYAFCEICQAPVTHTHGRRSGEVFVTAQFKGVVHWLTRLPEPRSWSALETGNDTRLWGWYDAAQCARLRPEAHDDLRWAAGSYLLPWPAQTLPYRDQVLVTLGICSPQEQTPERLIEYWRRLAGAMPKRLSF